MTIFDKARKIKDKDQLYTFIAELSLNSESPTTNTAAAAIATVFTLKDEFDLADFQVNEMMWLFIDNLISNEEKSIITTTLEIRKTLFPKPGQAGVLISPEIFGLIQAEARNLLGLHPDAVDSEKHYWKSLVKGIIPKGITVSEEVTKNI